MQRRQESRQSKLPDVPKIVLRPSSWRSGSKRKSTIPSVVVPVVGPAGQRPRLLANVVLGVAVVGAEREQLHQLAAVVLVRRPPLVLVAGQPDEHRRVDRHRQQQVLERAEPALAEQLVLLQVQRDLPDVGGREPVVPDQRHPLDERLIGADHPIEPPEQVVPPGVARRQRQSVVVVRCGSVQPRLALRAGQRQHRPAQSLAAQLRRFARGRAEAGAPEQALGLLGAEAAAVDGNRHCLSVRQEGARP